MTRIGDVTRSLLLVFCHSPPMIFPPVLQLEWASHLMLEASTRSRVTSLALLAQCGLGYVRSVCRQLADFHVILGYVLL